MAEQANPRKNLKKTLGSVVKNQAWLGNPEHFFILGLMDRLDIRVLLKKILFKIKQVRLPSSVKVKVTVSSLKYSF